MISRRKFVKHASAASVAAMAGSTAAFDYQRPSAKKALRIAHITDIHLDSRPVAAPNFKKVLAAINGMKEKPGLIINTGDCVFRSDGVTYEAAGIQWDLFSKTLHDNNRITLKSCLGNHDVWSGPDEKSNETYKTNKRYHKSWALEVLNLPGNYYSFEQNGWYFIALDSINDDEYSLGRVQFDWLEKELQRIPADKPICVFSHVSIISVIPLLRAMKDDKLEDIRYPGSRQHLDALQLKDLFYKHPNVKLCLSGHTHQVDHIDFLGVRYLCGGAVCGNWWADDHRLSMVFDGFPPAYTIIDLFEDGSIYHQNIFYPYIPV